MRRLGFYLSRENQLKVLGPVLDHLVRGESNRFHPVVLVPAWKTAKKALDREGAVRLQAQFAGRLTVEILDRPAALMELVKQGAFDAFVNLMPVVAEIDEATLQAFRSASYKAGIKWIALPYIFAQDQFVLEQPAAVVERWDMICTVGAQSIAYLERELSGVEPCLARRLRERIVITGYPELDAVDDGADAIAIRRKYRLPADKPLVLVATAPSMSAHGTSWRLRGTRARFSGTCTASPGNLLGCAASARDRIVIPYRKYLGALRRFADANGALLVGKTRAKHDDPAYVQEALDLLIGDVSFFPFTTLELMRVSSLYFGFYSATVMEAVACGVHAITALFLPPDLVPPQPQWRRGIDFFERLPGGLWDTPGVSSVIEGTRRSGAAALGRFAGSSLDDYAGSKEYRREVLSKYVSFLGCSSPRVTDAIDACLA
jgi:hypothetical protein